MPHALATLTMMAAADSLPDPGYAAHPSERAGWLVVA